MNECTIHFRSIVPSATYGLLSLLWAGVKRLLNNLALDSGVIALFSRCLSSLIFFSFSMLLKYSGTERSLGYIGFLGIISF